MAYIRTVLLLLLLSLLTACSVSNDAPVRVNHAVSGTVQVPAQLQAALQQRKTGVLARLLALVSSPSWADISGNVGGFVPVSGVTVELVRLNYIPATGDYYETVVACEGGCPVTAADGSFTVYTSEPASSTLALRVSFIDPADGVTPVVMRAMVYGDSVDVTPISEAAAQIILANLNLYDHLDNYTVNEVNAIVNLVEDEGIDVSGLNFTDAITKIKDDASDILSGFIAGFQSGGEMNVANANDIFHIVELRNRLVAPNPSFPEGALDYEATTGGAVSFDENGDFQIGSALYYWGLRSIFSGNPVRLFDQALNELDQTPATPSYDIMLTYGVPVGFRGITAADNGMVVANSNTEATTYGFLSNDGGMLAMLSERNDDAQSIYDRGLRIMMRKWKGPTNNYNEAFTNNTINYTDGFNGGNYNQGNQSSIDLNPIMDDPPDQIGTNYNVITYQHFLNDSGVEVGAGTGEWSFDTYSQTIVVDTSVAPSERYHGQVMVNSQNIDAVQYPYATNVLTRTASKPIEPCPNLFVIVPGGTMMLRRDTSLTACNGLGSNIFAGTGAVSSDGEVFVIPQVYDDSEDNIELEHPMPASPYGARRGWYIGVRQPDPLTPLTNAHLNGIYHVVGQVTELDDVTGTDSVSHQTFHGSLQFYSGLVSGTLHRKGATLDAIDINDGISPLLSSAPSIREDFIDSGTYQAAANGTVAITLPGITDAVTGVAGQVFNFNGTDIAMFLAVPINRNSVGKGARGLMLLAHEFLVDYPIPPDPPGPPTPPAPPP